VDEGQNMYNSEMPSELDMHSVQLRRFLSYDPVRMQREREHHIYHIVDEEKEH